MPLSCVMWVLSLDAKTKETETESEKILVSHVSSYRCAISDQKRCANWCAGDDVMHRDQPTRHDDLCVSRKAKYFRSFRDSGYVVQ